MNFKEKLRLFRQSRPDLAHLSDEELKGLILSWRKNGGEIKQIKDRRAHLRLVK